MGGRRSGKTSVLAGIVDNFVNGKIKDILAIKDVSEGANNTLQNKVHNLTELLATSNGKTILVDDSSTQNVQRYILEFSIPGTKNKMEIVFNDVNGEYYESGGRNNDEISGLVGKSDVFIIAIDTPSLMEAVNPENPLMNEPLNKAINRVQDIHNFITMLDDKDGADAKMVIFVPLKCEKWAKENRLDEVFKRVKTVYDTPLMALSKMKNVKVDILPIQTVGSIVFSEHLKSFTCITESMPPKRCSIFNNRTSVRFGDGYEREIDSVNDRFKIDAQSTLIEGSSLLRPNSWFKVCSSQYAPRNCDQLAYYILQFVLAKYLFIKEIEEKRKEEERRKKSWWNFGLSVIVAFINIPAAITIFVMSKIFNNMGSISYDQLKSVIDSLESRHLIKHEVEGIHNLQKSLLNI